MKVRARKLKNGKLRLYHDKIDPITKKRKVLGTFESLEAAHEKFKDIIK